jgi:rhamnosyltransferase subunit B
MSHIALAPLGSAGDVLPFLWLARQLRARGHEVTLMTASPFRQAIERAGMPFIPVGTDEEFFSVQRDPRLWKPYRGTQLVLEHVGRNASRYYEALLALHRRQPVDLVLAPVIAFGARIFLESARVPFVTVHLQPGVIFSLHDTPVFFNGMAWTKNLPRLAKRIIFSLPNPADRCALPHVRAACRSAGVTPPRGLIREWWHSPDGVLLLFPAWYSPPQPDWPRECFQHAFPLEDLAAEEPLPPALGAFLAGGPAPVVFTAGSANVQAAEFFRVALEASRRIGARAVFVTRDHSQLPPSLPPEACAVEYVAFSRVLPHASVFVHHGGIGTLSQGFAAGVPQLLMPMAHDQPDNADRLARLGAGLSLSPARFTAAKVASALRRLLEESSFAAASRICAQRVKEAPGPEAMLRWLEARMRSFSHSSSAPGL